ncbi:MAG: hypothetical protein Q9M97_09405 [Candidatus Gracilibacteria bacterium]|nr:hypothetical protein [Candidatus Gracilibacteria bacterium]
MMKTINSNIKLPSYVDIKSYTSSIFNGDNFSLALNDEGKINFYTSGLGAINSIAGEIDDLGNINGLGFFDNGLNGDVVENNNEIDLKDAVKIAGKIENDNTNVLAQEENSETLENGLSSEVNDFIVENNNEIDLKDVVKIAGKIENDNTNVLAQEESSETLNL